jgi:hypothetical protein
VVDFGRWQCSCGCQHHQGLSHGYIKHKVLSGAPCLRIPCWKRTFHEILEEQRFMSGDPGFAFRLRTLFFLPLSAQCTKKQEVTIPVHGRTPRCTKKYNSPVPGKKEVSRTNQRVLSGAIRFFYDNNMSHITYGSISTV